MKLVDLFVLIILIILIVFGVYFIWQNLPGEVHELKPVDSAGSEVKSIYSNGTQFYPNMRFPDKRISYHISPDCDGKRTENALEAFNDLSVKTKLTFYRTESKPEIEILCSDVSSRPEYGGHFVAGEGEPTEIIDSGLFYVILSSKASLYREDKCSEPKIAEHEILHTLGFDHNNNPKSIMYPVSDCNEILDQYIIDEINRLYSTDSKPDLMIKNAEVRKSNRYLSFEVEIVNQGLKEAKKSNLTVYADGLKIRDFEINATDIGIRKTLTVENLRVPYKTETVTLFVYITNGESEIYNDNNKAEFALIE